MRTLAATAALAVVLFAVLSNVAPYLMLSIVEAGPQQIGNWLDWRLVFSTIVGSLPAVGVAVFAWRAAESSARANATMAQANTEMARVMRQDFNSRERPYVHVAEITARVREDTNTVITPLQIKNVGPVPAVIPAVEVTYNKPGSVRQLPHHQVAVFPSEAHVVTTSIQWEGSMLLVDPRLELKIRVTYGRLGNADGRQYFTEHRFRIDFGTPGEMGSVCWGRVSTEGT